MFLNLGVSRLEFLGNSSIFVIYNFLDLFELKMKLSIVIMLLSVSDETMKLLPCLSRDFYGPFVLALLWATIFFRQPALWVECLFNSQSDYCSYFVKHGVN